VKAFDNAVVDELTRFGPGEDGTEGQVKRARLSIGSQSLILFDSPPIHAFSFTPAVSFFVEFETEAEFERVCTTLAEGGTTLMPDAGYPFARRFTWFNDRFGVSWQLSLT
jgi:predicted 3-demethylubiquinone-9 3-methyltransferase (glyoxalase superfamily)